MTKQEIYEQVVQLTSEVFATNVGNEIVGAVYTEDVEKVDSVFKNFEIENPELYQRIVNFGEEINRLIDSDSNVVEIFGLERDEENGIFVFDTNEIDSLSLYTLSFLGNFDEFYLFVYSDVETEEDEDPPETATDRFADAIEIAVNYELAEFLSNASWKDYVGFEDEQDQYESLPELLIGIFKGKFKGYFD